MSGGLLASVLAEAEPQQCGYWGRNGVRSRLPLIAHNIEASTSSKESGGIEQAPPSPRGPSAGDWWY